MKVRTQHASIFDLFIPFIAEDLPVNSKRRVVDVLLHKVGNVSAEPFAYGEDELINVDERHPSVTVTIEVKAAVIGVGLWYSFLVVSFLMLQVVRFFCFKERKWLVIAA